LLVSTDFGKILGLPLSTLLSIPGVGFLRRMQAGHPPLVSGSGGASSSTGFWGGAPAEIEFGAF